MDEKQSINGTASAVVENECPTTSNGHLVGPETEAGRVEASAEEDNSLDAILVRIGQFGRFQLINYALLCVPMVFNAFFSISYVFTASTVVQR